MRNDEMTLSVTTPAPKHEEAGFNLRDTHDEMKLK